MEFKTCETLTQALHPFIPAVTAAGGMNRTEISIMRMLAAMTGYEKGSVRNYKGFIRLNLATDPALVWQAVKHIIAAAKAS